MDLVETVKQIDEEKLTRLLNLMLAKRVAAFEIDGFKVSFRSDAGIEEIKSTPEKPNQRKRDAREELDEELGLPWGDDA